MSTLPESTDKKIKKIMNKYKKTKWEVIVMAIDAEYDRMLTVERIIETAHKEDKK